MAFDGTHFELPPEPPPVPPRRAGERSLMVALGVLALGLMAIPVPFSALADLVRYLLAAHR